LECPSSQAVLLTPCGRATQKRFLTDIAIVADVLVSDMCLKTRMIGHSLKIGFWLDTWAFVAKKCNMPLWRVKQCADRMKENGWLESTQPRKKTINTDKSESWTPLTSIKRITMKYFKDLGLEDAFEGAQKANKPKLEALAKKYGKPLNFILTPISMLDELRRQRAATASSPPL
jgi:hypothetical protein